jgi:choline dehydrogenase-like flavoprotein
MEMWATVVNDSSYSFDEVLPFYKKSVQFTPPNTDYRAQNASADYDADAYESDAGPLQVSYANFAEPFSSWMSLGMEAIGIDQAKEFNLGTLMGAQYCASTIDPSSELRSSSEESFLSKITPMSLTTYKHTLAKKVVFDENKRAIGIQVKSLLENTITFSASEEVIISAGAFHSPQLLMVSGIGPEDQLKEHGIDIIANRPGVGQNMSDHTFFAPSYRVRVTTFTEFATNLLYAADQFVKGVLTRKGPLTSPIADFLAWEKIPQFMRSTFSERTLNELDKFPSDWPEAEVRGYSVQYGEMLLICISIVHFWRRVYRQRIKPPDKPAKRWIPVCLDPRCSDYTFVPRKCHFAVRRYLRSTSDQPQLVR